MFWKIKVPFFSSRWIHEFQIIIIAPMGHKARACALEHWIFLWWISELLIILRRIYRLMDLFVSVLWKSQMPLKWITICHCPEISARKQISPACTYYQANRSINWRIHPIAFHVLIGGRIRRQSKTSTGRNAFGPVQRIRFAEWAWFNVCPESAFE